MERRNDFRSPQIPTLSRPTLAPVHAKVPHVRANHAVLRHIDMLMPKGALPLVLVDQWGEFCESGPQFIATIE
jgi:hypothetical protein